MSDTQEVRSNLELEVSLSDVFLIIREKWKVLFGFTLSFAFLGVLYALSLPEIYRANVLMSEATETGQLGGGAMSSAFGGIMDASGAISFNQNTTAVDEGLALMKSRRFAEEFISQNDLLILLFADDWDANKESWLDGERPGQWRVYRKFQNMMSTSTSSDGLITLTLEYTDPILVAKWANAIIAFVNDMMREEAISEAEKSIQFLESELKKTSLVNSQTILYSLIEQQTEKIMIASVREQYSFKVIDPAITPDVRVSPNRRNTVMFFAIMGLFFGFIVIAFLISMPKIR